MLQKLLIAVALAALVTAAAASAASGSHRRILQESVSTTQLMPGVTYTREVEFTPAGPLVLDVVTAPKPDGTVYSLAPVVSNGTLARTQKLTAIEQQLDANATTVGIDGDYFNAKSGVPSGIVMAGGVLDAQPAAGRSSLGITTDGTLQVARLTFSGTWQGSGQTHALDLNPVSAGGKFALYTPAYGATTPSESGVVEAVISSLPPTELDQPLDGTVTQVTNAGGTPIPRGGAVLVAHGSQSEAKLTAEAPVGQPLEVRLMLSPDWSGLAGALGGGPALVENGQAVFSAGESFAPGGLNNREARGAVGQLSDGRIVLVTVEGASPAYSVGMSNYGLALALVELGVKTAFGLAAGPDAAMAFDGELLTRPSTGHERAISDALVLSYSGVYASPPSVSVLSPNGDGVADTQTLTYRLVRPSTVVAALDGPGGTTIPLANDVEQPGVHTIDWNGKVGNARASEGTWTFTVTATDDRGITTTAQRAFTLDDTLGSLAVAYGSSGFPTASFELSRPARVVVRIERRNGVAVATILSASLPAGTQHVRWKGRIGKKHAPRGRYQVDVQATSSIGTSSLVAPFILR